MFFVDKDIRKLLEEHQVIILSVDGKYPFDPVKQIGPGSIDLRMSTNILRYKPGVDPIGLEHEDTTEATKLADNEILIIQPHEIILTTTLELVSLPANIAGIIMGRSSIARLGLLIHVSQEFMQPGHEQLVPLQLVNITNHPIKIKTLIPICQIMLLTASSKAEVPYSAKENAKYRDELTGPQPSKIRLDLNPTSVQQGTNNQPDSGSEAIKEKLLKEKLLATDDHYLKFQGKIDRIMTLVYIILGAGISLVIQELDVRPFPSLTLVIGGAFALLSIATIILANWGK